MGLAVCAHAAFVYLRLGEFGAVGFARIGFVLAHVFKNCCDAFVGLDVRNPRAHHSRAQQAHFARFKAGAVARARLSALDGIEVKEKGIDHGPRVAARHQTRKRAAFNAQRRWHIDLQAFHHARQDRLGGRVQAPRLLLQHGRGDRQHACDFRVAG